MLPDYHIHTPLCRHAAGEPEEFLAAARKKNLPEICFTDHAPNPDNYDRKNRMSIDEFELYKRKVRAVAMSGNFNSGRTGPRSKLGEQPACHASSVVPPFGRTRLANPTSTSTQPQVLFGVEADYYEGCERFLREWLPRQNLDLVIGSIHYLHNWGFDNPDEREVWDNIDVADTWHAYFALVGRLADTGLFDIVGHFDLTKKFGHFPPEKAIREMARPVLEKIARAKMAVEINTSGLRKPVKEIYPSRMLLTMAREQGIPICFGSDAHQPDEVGYKFAAALKLAQSAGYSEAVRFSGRNKIAYSLPGSFP